MASREKRPLAPSKSKQRANNNDSGLPSSPSKTKKEKTLPSYILKAVATGSKLSSKLETAALPRKKVCANLKCKKKLRQTKGNHLKVVKSQQKIPAKNLKRLAATGSAKTAKKILNRTKKSKNLTKPIDIDLDSVPLSDLITDSTICTQKSSNIKSSRRLKSVSPESKAKGKTLKKPKEESEVFDINKFLKSRKSSLGNKNSIDLTIDEVCAMHSDGEMDETERIKLTRNKKMILDESEIKKEIIDDEEQKSDDENITEIMPEGSASQSRKRTSTRSLRNGKLRPLDTIIDGELKKNRRLASEDTSVSESGAENTTNDAESCVSESSLAETSSAMAIKEEGMETSDSHGESENNNNSSDRVGGSGDAGPNLRSKTKAKSTDTQIKVDDAENDEIKMIQLKNTMEDTKKSSSVDQLRKDCLLGKVPGDKQPIKRRSSLNIDVKKTMGSLYGNEKCDGSIAPTSQIDQMIENIKLTIAKSIEIKFLGPDKGLSLGKNFDVPKIEEIVAPLSTEMKTLDEDEKNKPNVSNSELESTNSTPIDENSIPKVADTAKEIEKLVMGDIKTSSLDVKPEQQQTTSKDTTNKDISENTVEQEENISFRSQSSASASCSTDDKYQDKPTSRAESRTDNKEESPMKTDDSETLETISKEVERLVTEATVEILPEVQQRSLEVIENESESTPVEGEGNNILDITESLEKEEKLNTHDDKVSSESEILENENYVIEYISEECSKESGMKIDSPVKIQANQLEKTKNTQDKVTIEDEEKIKEDKVNIEETKSVVEENRRVLRTRDKQKKIEKSSPKTSESSETSTKSESDNSRTENIIIEVSTETVMKSIKEDETVVVKIEEPEPQTRTRRSRDVKKRKDETSPILKSKRNRRETKRTDQQNKEETLLDNEVATINENKRSFTQEKFAKRLEGTESLRVFSEEERRTKSDNRSKSENDIESTVGKTERRISRGRCETDEPKETNIPMEIVSDVDNKPKTPINLQKDSDEASNSGESTSSVSLKLLETPEDKARKESILRMLGLESMEKAAERMNQKAKREQYTGTLKTVIRVQKDKKRSRSPLKLVFNRQGRADGEGVSPEFYTIQKELGTSGLGDSSSGANRKFSTNHRQSCDEESEETTSKDRQSLIIPEKSSSFSIHPGRLCADVCCYCFGKFGSLDTPMHLAQLKSDERRKKILSHERHLTKDSCLCDACYRHVDRKANVSPTNANSKPQRVHRQLLVSKCYVKDCKQPARHLVKRRWLHKIKSCVQNRVNIDINWEPSQHTSMSFCVDHYQIIERFLTCSLCTRRLARNATHQISALEADELNRLLEQQGIPIPLQPATFVCKLCRYYTQVQLKYKPESMNANHRSFCKSYRIRILHYNGIEVLDNDEDDESSQSTSSKDKRKKSKNQTVSSVSKSSSVPPKEEQTSSEKSTPEPHKPDPIPNPIETELLNVPKVVEKNAEGASVSDHQVVDLESTVEKLKKRKALDQHLYSTESPVFSDNNGSDVVEILAMDKEVTLTRLPKRSRISNDITPVVQRLGANPSISVRTLFPGEEEMGLHANVEFTNVREVTPQGWEKCATIIQYDRDTKLLWQELQRPYGNQSSFLRHLILLEKYYRSGDLVLAPNASRNAINYSTSVQNRLISYEGPEKSDEPINEPITTDFNNSSRRLSGGYMMERDRLSIPSTSTMMTTSTITSTPIKSNSGGSPKSPTRILKLNPGVSIIKKPPPNLQRLNLPSSSGTNLATNGSSKRKDTYPSKITGSTSGGKVFQLSEPEFKRLQTLKKQKMLNEKMGNSTTTSSGSNLSNNNNNNNTNNNNNNSKANLLLQKAQKAQLAAQTQFQKHLRMQQEMLNRQSRGDFEPLICDVRSLANENTPAQNLLNNLNLPKSIQVTTKPSNNPIPILPKIPKSLTVIPQTVSRHVEK